jgi:hypothetical protein
LRKEFNLLVQNLHDNFDDYITHITDEKRPDPSLRLLGESEEAYI